MPVNGIRNVLLTVRGPNRNVSQSPAGTVSAGLLFSTVQTVQRNVMPDERTIERRAGKAIYRHVDWITRAQLATITNTTTYQINRAIQLGNLQTRTGDRRTVLISIYSAHAWASRYGLQTRTIEDQYGIKAASDLPATRG